MKLRTALQETMALVRETNAYLDKRAPWKRIKEDRQDAATAVYTVLRVIDNGVSVAKLTFAEDHTLSDFQLLNDGGHVAIQHVGGV